MIWKHIVMLWYIMLGSIAVGILAATVEKYLKN